MTTTTVAELCRQLVAEYFASDDGKKSFKLVELDDFNATGSLLGELLSEGITMANGVPALLLHDLRTVGQQEAFNFIDSTRDICSGLYATSGAGKTRSIFEYLTQHFGLYFVAIPKNNYGSKDLDALLLAFGRNYTRETFATIPMIDSQEKDYQQRLLKEKIARSESNFRNMERYVMIMVYARMIVFGAINKQLKRNGQHELTAHNWLIIQLFPKLVFGVDLFRDVVNQCFSLVNKDPTDASVSDAFAQAGAKTWPSQLMVVDEAQHLTKELSNFFLSADGKRERFAFSAVLQGMAQIPGLLGSDDGLPLVAGTGMSIDDMRDAADSIMAKAPLNLGENRTIIFKNFKPLDQAGVRRYLLRFLTLDVNATTEEGVPNSCVINHISNWLRGRPRWTASFLELYMVRKMKDNHDGTRGSFSRVGALLMQALDRYIDNYTQPTLDEDTSNEDRRKSYEPPEGTAYSSIRRIVEIKREYEISKKLESAIYKFALGGQPMIIDDHYATLIETGVATLCQTKKGAIIDEPLIIQAGIKYFSLAQMAIKNMTVQERTGQGAGFEKVMLPAIQMKLPQILAKQLDAMGEALKDLRVPKRSAYGMLAIHCSSPKETIQWIEDATKSTFEGQVVPFCYPDEHIGPDLIFLMWDRDYKSYIPVISQAKYREHFNQMDALRTLTPSLLYHQSRDKPDKRKLSTMITSDGDVKTRWEAVRPMLVGKTQGCVRFMVQYPSYGTASATPGVLEDNQEKVLSEDQTVGKKRKREGDVETRKLGWLATISKDNAPDLFSNEDLEILDKLKA